MNLPRNRILWTLVEITQILNEQECTIDDAEKIIQLLSSYIKQQREDIEYGSTDNYILNRKINNASNKIIEAMNHTDGYC